jgi:hypothetical protein
LRFWGDDAEDVIVIGFLVALSLWLFVGLPLLNWFSIMDHQHQAEFVTWLAPVLIGFLGGSVMSWILAGIQRWWTRPILSARLVQGRGCYVTTSRGNPPTHDARFLRLLIENRGRSTIHNCKGYITAVTQSVNGNRTPLQQEVLELEWSSGGAAEPRSIPRRAFFYMNVASLDLVQHGPPCLRFAVLWTPNHFGKLFGPAATFELEIKVAADNAAPVDRMVCFEFDPQWQDLHFGYD